MGAATAAVLVATLGACTATGTAESGPESAGSSERSTDTATPDPEPTVPTPTVRSNVSGTGEVTVDTAVKLRVRDGSFDRVKVRSPQGRLPGSMNDAGTRWKAAELLEPGTTYQVVTVADDAEGNTTKDRSSFSTTPLTLDEQTYPSVAPLQGETVGVGMPAIVSFDVPVTNRAAFERHMQVTTTPRQPGAWHWLSDYEAHWRPKSYWKPGTEVSVAVDVNGVDAGNGIYGQKDRTVDFTVGDAHVYQVDAAAHTMRVLSNGELLRTIPITAGKPGFTTRSGTKVIMAKFASKRMNSETVGIDADSAEGYDLDNVEYAMRLTNSGEFIHAAPWSVASQGNANVSHGCTGLSTENAGWLFDLSRRGDVVEYTGTDRPMTLDNGYGDWNASFKDYKQASALS